MPTKASKAVIIKVESDSGGLIRALQLIGRYLPGRNPGGVSLPGPWTQISCIPPRERGEHAVEVGRTFKKVTQGR